MERLPGMGMYRAERRLRLARYWYAVGDLAEAARYARRALRLTRARPTAPLDLAVEVALLAARVERDLDHGTTALDILVWTLGLLYAEPAGTDRDRLLATVLTELADCHRRAGRYPQAVHALARARHLARHSEPAQHAATLAMLGIVAKERGAFDEAARYYAQAGEVHDRAGTRPGDAATLQRDLAGLAHAQQRFGQAETHARRAVELRRQAPGATVADVAPDLAVLAAALAGQHRYDEAGALLTLAATAYRTARPPRALAFAQPAYRSDRPTVAALRHDRERAGSERRSSA